MCANAPMLLKGESDGSGEISQFFTVQWLYVPEFSRTQTLSPIVPLGPLPSLPKARIEYLGFNFHYVLQLNLKSENKFNLRMSVLEIARGIP